MVVRELINLIGFEVDQQGESRAKKALQGMQAAAKVAAAGVAAGAAAMGVVAKTAADSINEIARNARDANVSTQSFQAISGAIESMGGEAEDARSAMAELALRAQEAFEDPGGGMAERFARYGIAVRDANGNLRSTEDLLMQVADASKALEDAGQSAKFLQDELIGDSDAQGLAGLLNMGAAGFQAELDRISKARLFLSDDEVEAAQSFGKVFSLLQDIASDLFRKFGAALLPAITQTAQAVVRFVEANKDLISGRIRQGVEVLTAVVGHARGMFNRLADSVGGVEPLLKIVAGAAAILAIAMFGPAIAIGAVITGIALLVDDLIAWANGSESLIGKFLGPFEEMPGSVRAIFDIIGDTVRAFVDLVGAIFSGDLGGIMDALGDILLAPVRLILNGLAGLVDGAIAIINGVIEKAGFIGDLVGGPIEFSAADAAQSLFSANESAAGSIATGAGSPAGAIAARPPVNIGETKIDATFNVPPGTTEEQLRHLRDGFGEIVDEKMAARDRAVVEDAPDQYGQG